MWLLGNARHDDVDRDSQIGRSWIVVLDFHKGSGELLRFWSVPNTQRCLFIRHQHFWILNNLELTQLISVNSNAENAEGDVAQIL